jgi:hypothetical protein
MFLNTHKLNQEVYLIVESLFNFIVINHSLRHAKQNVKSNSFVFSIS